MPHRIYSIESRKGGVGKTTIALNLASVLVKREPVLLIDCDISGTSIEAPSLTSPFWENSTNVLCYTDKDNKQKPLNILHYFINKYINGEGNVRDFINRDILKVSKVNIITSSLSGMTGHDAIIRDWYLDELHSYWMIECIQQIIKEFEDLYSEKMVHIIIDNSPGYTCFNQVLHDYMYEEGPLVAKYLLVSTLDNQDLKANIELAEEINESITNRTTAAKYYKKKTDDNKEGDDAFGKGLIESDDYKKDDDVYSERIIESDDDIKDFFYHLRDNKELCEIYNKDYASETYLALLINKVPQSLKDDETEVAFEDILGEHYGLFSSIVGVENSFPKNMIHYEEAIVYQYYMKYLRRKTDSMPRMLSYWNRRIKELKLMIHETESLLPINAMAKLNTYYNGLIISLNERGFAQLSRQLLNSWSPEYAIEDLKKEFTTGVESFDITNVERPSFELQLILHELNTEIQESIKTLVGEQSHEYKCLHDILFLLEEFTVRNSIRTRTELILLVSIIVYAFKLGYNRVGERRFTLREYALRIWSRPYHMYLFHQIKRDGIVVNSELKIDAKTIEDISSIVLSKTYRRFCYSLVRLMDQQIDFNILISAIQLYVPSSPQASFSEEMTNYLSEVITRKRLQYDEHRLYEIWANSYVMKNMQDVLSDNILKAWR